MKAIYNNSETEVLVGDYVEFKVWLFFWKGWQRGRVYYVPGQSPKKNSLEYNGLSWVSIHDENGSPTGILVDPKSGELRSNVRFIKRSDDGLKETPEGYIFEEDDEDKETEKNS